ncbi:hypothetical protein MMC25_007370 [Agyrium rufum]|nr:hypothetical protein [Agyrium rufum]
MRLLDQSWDDLVTPLGPRYAQASHASSITDETDTFLGIRGNLLAAEDNPWQTSNALKNQLRAEREQTILLQTRISGAEANIKRLSLTYNQMFQTNQRNEYSLKMANEEIQRRVEAMNLEQQHQTAAKTRLRSLTESLQTSEESRGRIDHLLCRHVDAMKDFRQFVQKLIGGHVTNGKEPLKIDIASLIYERADLTNQLNDLKVALDKEKKVAKGQSEQSRSAIRHRDEQLKYMQQQNTYLKQMLAGNGVQRQQTQTAR